MIAAYLCIEAITLSERKKEKDAYDMCFCIENYPGGYKTTRGRCRRVARTSPEEWRCLRQ